MVPEADAAAQQPLSLLLMLFSILLSLLLLRSGSDIARSKAGYKQYKLKRHPYFELKKKKGGRGWMGGRKLCRGL